MQQYLDLINHILQNGTHKGAAREGMPGTTSIFGYQMRFNLASGFPLITTRKINTKALVHELLWFLKGDSNIKYLVDNGVNIWNEDAYNYYVRKMKHRPNGYMDFDTFEMIIKSTGGENQLKLPFFKEENFTLGDCGFQYGRVWREWPTNETQRIVTTGDIESVDIMKDGAVSIGYKTGSVIRQAVYVDQIANLIQSLKKNPESRRHLLTALDPAHDTELALYWCHVLAQFNCRPLTLEERCEFRPVPAPCLLKLDEDDPNDLGMTLDEEGCPRYYLDCQLYQRSADLMVGVPYNIASYALLTHLIAKMLNMVPGHFIHTFGDVHIYENHIEQAKLQLQREPLSLCKLQLNERASKIADLRFLEYNDIKFENYQYHEPIKYKLSTGL